MTPGPPVVITPDTTQLKALTHPLRLRLLALLRLHGPATATALAAQVGESSGSMSYHLRQLARHGFVEEAEEMGTRRERWWRASALRTVTSSAAGSDEERAAKQAWRQVVVSQYARRLQASVEEHETLPPEWREPVAASDAVVNVTPEQAREITRRVNALVWEVLEEYPTPPEPGPKGTRPFEIQVHTYPTPGQG